MNDLKFYKPISDHTGLVRAMAYKEQNMAIVILTNDMYGIAFCTGKYTINKIMFVTNSMIDLQATYNKTRELTISKLN